VDDEDLDDLSIIRALEALEALPQQPLTPAQRMRKQRRKWGLEGKKGFDDGDGEVARKVLSISTTRSLTAGDRPPPI
jgi:hypothetical protein